MKAYIEVIEHNDTRTDADRISSEEESNILNRTRNHRENIQEIIIPEYEEDNYVITYSFKDDSIVRWTVNTGENGLLQPVVFLKCDDF